jgi:hypothetical protein
MYYLVQIIMAAMQTYDNIRKIKVPKLKCLPWIVKITTTIIQGEYIVKYIMHACKWCGVVWRERLD